MGQCGPPATGAGGPPGPHGACASLAPHILPGDAGVSPCRRCRLQRGHSTVQPPGDSGRGHFLRGVPTAPVPRGALRASSSHSTQRGSLGTGPCTRQGWCQGHLGAQSCGVCVPPPGHPAGSQHVRGARGLSSRGISSEDFPALALHLLLLAGGQGSTRHVAPRRVLAPPETLSFSPSPGTVSTHGDPSATGQGWPRCRDPDPLGGSALAPRHRAQHVAAAPAAAGSGARLGCGARHVLRRAPAAGSASPRWRWGQAGGHGGGVQRGTELGRLGRGPAVPRSGVRWGCARGCAAAVPCTGTPGTGRGGLRCRCHTVPGCPRCRGWCHAR